MRPTRHLALTALLAAAACGDNDGPTDPPTPTPTGATVLSGNITGRRDLSADTVYTLRGFVNVAEGAVLNIAAGTRIVGDSTVVGSALFVLPGGQIVARGTAARPIVFTSARAPGFRQPGDWGGLIIVGRARVNRPAPVIIEGSNATVGGAANPGVNYAGGTNDADNSGVLEYVRVEYAGFATVQDQELNSFTFAAVGRGTQLQYLQSLNGLDDSFEWFGGTVDGRYLVSYNSGDDHFDAAEGYSGRNQFLIAYQDTTVQPRAGAGSVASDPQGFEVDGCATGSGSNCPSQSAAPYTMPVFANFTVIGPGPRFQQSAGGAGMVIRRGAGGVYVNGVVARWGRHGLSVRDSTTNNRRLADSLQVRNVLFVENGATLDPAAANFTQPANFANAALDSTGATSSAALFVALPAIGATGLTAAAFDFTPATNSAAASGGMSTFTGTMQARAGTTVTATPYRGAAAPGGPRWWQGWTDFSRN